MADALSTTVKASIDWLFKETLATDGTFINDASTLSYTLDMLDGTTDASSQSDKIWHYKNAALTVAGPETLDLSALTLTVFGSTVTIAFVEVTAILIQNNSTPSTSIITVGAAGANAWTAPFGGTTPTIKVGPNSVWLSTNPLGTPWTVDGTHKNLLLTAAGATISYNIVIVGRSA